MTSRVIDDVEYFEVPSTKCCSVVAGLRCALHEKEALCRKTNCATGIYQMQPIAFLTAEKYRKWVAATTAARMTS